jgi:drug/metabolite transporter (DMT)-like permease
MLALVCGFVFAFDLWVWHSSIKYIGPGLATILGNFQVFILSFFGWLVFKEKISIKFLISLPLAFLGLFLIIGVDIGFLSRDYKLGVWLGLATAGFYSVFLLLLRQLQSDGDSFLSFFYMMLLSLACAVFLGMGIHFSGLSFNIPDMLSLVSLVGLGFFIQCVAWLMISKALPRVNASHAGLILLLQPSLSFVWDVVFFSRQTGIPGWAGVIIVLAAIYMGMGLKK